MIYPFINYCPSSSANLKLVQRTVLPIGSIIILDRIGPLYPRRAKRAIILRSSSRYTFPLHSAQVWYNFLCLITSRSKPSLLGRWCLLLLQLLLLHWLFALLLLLPTAVVLPTYFVCAPQLYHPCWSMHTRVCGCSDGRSSFGFSGPQRRRRSILSVSSVSFFIEETSREVVKFDCLSIDVMLLACVLRYDICLHAASRQTRHSISEREKSRSRCTCVQFHGLYRSSCDA